MPAKPDVDATDRRILSHLATDGRASYQSLADEVGLSRPAVMERVKRLEERGFITGYGARLDRVKAGYAVTAFVAVRYGNPEYVRDEARIKQLEKHPGVLECHHVAGDDCYIMKVAAPDLEGVQAILRQLAGGHQAINTRTTIVLGTLFEKPGITLPELD
jgi:Lrp/AsnC family leucine-responsive transcriptional regulator